MNLTQETFAGIQEAIESSTHRCKTRDDRDRVCIEVDRRENPFGARKTKHIVYIIPEGYRKLSFAHSVDARVSAGGSVKWLNDEPQDGTIVLYGWADGFSYVEACVWNVTAVRDD